MLEEQNIIGKRVKEEREKKKAEAEAKAAAAAIENKPEERPGSDV